MLIGDASSIEGRERKLARDGMTIRLLCGACCNILVFPCFVCTIRLSRRGQHQEFLNSVGFRGIDRALVQVIGHESFNDLVRSARFRRLCLFVQAHVVMTSLGIWNDGGGGGRCKRSPR